MPGPHEFDADRLLLGSSLGSDSMRLNQDGRILILAAITSMFIFNVMPAAAAEFLRPTLPAGAEPRLTKTSCASAPSLVTVRARGRRAPLRLPAHAHPASRFSLDVACPAPGSLAKRKPCSTRRAAYRQPSRGVGRWATACLVNYDTNLIAEYRGGESGDDRLSASH